jgi:preprotein translocase subunit SecE
MAEATTPTPALPNRSQQPKPSFFRVYKPGQGYYTRLGTALGAGIIILFTGYFVWKQAPLLVNAFSIPKNYERYFQLGCVLAVVLIMGSFTWWMTNKPKSVNFLSEVDSEMKRVNWATRAEWIGSTRIVIIFMLLITALLFAYDIIFRNFFYLIGVLKTGLFFGN